MAPVEYDKAVGRYEREGVNMETPISPKVTAGGAAGAAALVIVWVAGLFGLGVPPEVAIAFTVLLTTGASWIQRDKLRDAGQAAVNAPVDTPVGTLLEVQKAA